MTHATRKARSIHCRTSQKKSKKRKIPSLPPKANIIPKLHKLNLHKGTWINRELKLQCTPPGSCYHPKGKVEFEGTSHWFAHKFSWESVEETASFDHTYANRAASIQHSTNPNRSPVFTKALICWWKAAGLQNKHCESKPQVGIRLHP